VQVNNAVVVQVLGEDGPENLDQNPDGNGNGNAGVNQIELLPLEN
jgi:hypothetical protein